MSDLHAGDAGRATGEAGVSKPDAEVEHRTTDVVVVGGGVAGLVAALECAKVGLRVTVLERRDEIGGCVGRIELDGLTLDSGAESFATRGGAVAELLEQLGLADDIEKPNPAGAWLVWHGRGGVTDAAPLPKTGVLGIPANPLGDDVRRIIGWSGATRAYADRLMPIMRIGRAHSLGKLVRTRMGDAVLDRLVTPDLGGRLFHEPRRPRPRCGRAGPQRGDDPHGLPLGRGRPAARGAQGRHRDTRPARWHVPARRRARGATRPLRRRGRHGCRGHCASRGDRTHRPSGLLNPRRAGASLPPLRDPATRPPRPRSRPSCSSTRPTSCSLRPPMRRAG